MFKSLNHISIALENQSVFQQQQQLQQVLNCWAEVVGEQVAQHTRPYGISRDSLDVATSSSVWVQDLKFRRYFILKQLNAHLSSPLADIRFSTSQWHQDSTELSSSEQEHPSYVGEAIEECGGGTFSIGSTSSVPDSKPNPQNPQSAFQQWSQRVQARSLSLPLCPQCQCPTPLGELQRWSVCSLCATKQWKV